MENLVNALESFRGKRVLITGDTGFKGSWLSLWLHNHGAKVFGYALPALDHSHFNDLQLGSLIDHQDGDIRDLERLKARFIDVQPDVVFHLAAQPIVRLSYRDPVQTFDTNIGGSTNLLECVRLTESVKALVFITSDKCYRNIEQDAGYTEQDVLGGSDPYSASKGAAELVFAAYNASFFVQRDNLIAASARAGNVIGGGDWAEDRIIPDCIRSLQHDTPIHIRNPRATRPWQHVLEPLSGYILLGSEMLKGNSVVSGSWNFGPRSDEVRSVSDVTQEAIAIWGSGSVTLDDNRDHPHEATLLQLDCSKAQAELNWSPQWDFVTTMEKTVSWYQLVHQGTQAISVTQQQLTEYEIGKRD
jgi:CDP-glucose 4,6-dehydratase